MHYSKIVVYYTNECKFVLNILPRFGEVTVGLPQPSTLPAECQRARGGRRDPK